MRPRPHPGKLVHEPLTQVPSGPQALPHTPQFLGSSRGWTQDPLPQHIPIPPSWVGQKVEVLQDPSMHWPARQTEPWGQDAVQSSLGPIGRHSPIP
jgi:hypothetical protein